MRRKIAPNVLPRASTSRPVASASSSNGQGYAAIVARARALGLVAVLTIAPLGALAGTVSACGGAAPVRAMPHPEPYALGGAVAPVQPEPATSSSASQTPTITPISPPGTGVAE